MPRPRRRCDRVPDPHPHLPRCAGQRSGAGPGRGVRARPVRAPGAHRAAELTCAHYLPVGRATALLATLAGIRVSVGFVAGVRGRAARLLERAFLPRVRELLGTVGVPHADETPARAHGGLEYVHIAATEWLTAMHTGGRTATDIDNGAVLPGYPGMIVRDGYAGYTHLTDAYHAWSEPTYCATWPRSTAPTPTNRRGQRRWPTCSSTPTTTPNPPAPPAPSTSTSTTLTDLRRRYLGAYAAGIRDNHNRAGPLAQDGPRWPGASATTKT